MIPSALKFSVAILVLYFSEFRSYSGMPIFPSSFPESFYRYLQRIFYPPIPMSWFTSHAAQEPPTVDTSFTILYSLSSVLLAKSFLPLLAFLHTVLSCDIFMQILFDICNFSSGRTVPLQDAWSISSKQMRQKRLCHSGSF